MNTAKKKTATQILKERREREKIRQREYRATNRKRGFVKTAAWMTKEEREILLNILKFKRNSKHGDEIVKRFNDAIQEAEG